MALKSKAEVEMNLKYPYKDEFMNNLLSSLPESLQELLKMTISDMVPSATLIRKMLRTYDKQSFDMANLVAEMIETLFPHIRNFSIF